MDFGGNIQKMIGRIKSIIREADFTYRVSFETLDGELIGSFLFTVANDEVEGVGWDSDFDSYRGPTPLRMGELWSAIVAFHHAQQMELPPKK